MGDATKSVRKGEGVRKLLKRTLYVVGGLVVFVLLLAGATQTQLFRDRLRAAALANLQSLFDADIRLGNLQGNLVTGFSIDSISISVRGRNFLRADRLDLRYNLFEIPGRSISIGSMTVVRPDIAFFRSAGGRWNLQEMIRPSPPDTGKHEPFDWVISLNRFEIQNGTLSLTDSASLSTPDHAPEDTTTVEYHNFTVRNLNLVMSAILKEDEKRAVISSLSFLADRPAFRLRRLAGAFVLTPKECRVDNFVLTTDRTDFTMNASMREVDLLGGLSLERLRRNPIALEVRAPEIDFEELARFLPPLSFLRGAVAVDMDVSGEFGDLTVRRLIVKRSRTELSLRGTVANLHNPGNLWLNVKLTESKIDPADPVELMPSLNLPDLRPLGLSTVNLEFEGRPTDFRSKFLVETAAGSVQSETSLRIGGPPTLTYKSMLVLHDVNLARIIGDERYTSALQGTVTIEGKGTAIGNLDAQLAVALDSSQFAGQPVHSSRVSLEAHDRRVSCAALLAVGGMSSALSVELNEQAGTAPWFTIDGGASSLNLRDLLGDESYDSDLTLRLKAHGTRLTLGSVSGDAVLELSDSRFRNFEIDTGNVHIALDQSDSLHKSLTLESNLADVALTGSFNLETLPGLIAFEAQNLRRAIGAKFASIDSALAASIDLRSLDALRARLEARPATLNAHYTLHVKDLEPLSRVVGGGYTGSGLLKGSIAGGLQNLSLTGNLTVDEFSYGTADAGMLIQNGRVTFDLGTLKPENPIREMDVRLDVKGDRVTINRNEFDSVQVNLAYNREHARYSGGLWLNGEYRLGVAGDAGVTEDAITFELSRLVPGYQDFVWSADPGALLRIDREGFAVRGLVMRRNSQSVAIDGSVGLGGALQGTVNAQKLDLDGLRYVLAKEENTSAHRAFAGVAAVKISAAGTLAQPRYTASVHAEDIAYRSVPFGSLSGDFVYDTTMLSVLLRLGDKGAAMDSAAKLTVIGTIPLDLRLARSSGGLPDRPMDLTIKSDGLQMSILDPFLPTFNDLTGIMTCSLMLSGTPASPRYGGMISLARCGFLFVPNNIYYTCEGTFQPSGEKIRVVDAVIRNVPADNQPGRQGEIHVRGEFTLKDLVPGDFDLSATGQLLVVKEETLRSSLSMYGNLFVEIGTGGLHFTGSLDESLLRGYLLIRNSTLIFPPTRAVAGQQASFSVPIVVVDDTTRRDESALHAVTARYFGTDGSASNRAGGDDQDIPRGKSFLDGVRYDLEIETSGGNTEIRMEFNPATNEELQAVLDGKFTITGDGTKWYGDLKVNSATYNFFKKFDATGSLRFTGDLLNPELNIDAKYTGTRVTPDTTGVTEKVVVDLKITGTRNEPKLDISMTINNVDYYSYEGRTSHDVQSDAISFILAGNFPLTTEQKNDVASNFRSTAGLSILSGATSLLTGQLSQFLRNQTGFINDLQVSYDPSSTLGGSVDIRLSGTVSKALWKYGGKIIDDPLSNANFSLQYSVGDIFEENRLRNLMFELERKVEPTTIGQLNELKRVNSARLFYRLSF